MILEGKLLIKKALKLDFFQVRFSGTVKKAGSNSIYPKFSWAPSTLHPRGKFNPLTDTVKNNGKNTTTDGVPSSLKDTVKNNGKNTTSDDIPSSGSTSGDALPPTDPTSPKGLPPSSLVSTARSRKARSKRCSDRSSKTREDKVPRSGVYLKKDNNPDR